MESIHLDPEDKPQTHYITKFIYEHKTNSVNSSSNII